MMNIKKWLASCLALVSLGAQAELRVGDMAPDFTAQASMAGKVSTWSLQNALKQGPVVLYFYPAAFTPGCTAEAHDFAKAIDQYKALHASVIGVSHDPIEKLQRFSVSECRSKFPVAADTDGSIMNAYGAVMPVFSNYASRTSYVIAPNGKIIGVYSNMNPSGHVSTTLDTLKKWNTASHPN